MKLQHHAILLCCFICGCSKSSSIRDFNSDGCSLFPDRSLISQEDWCECCFEHDIAYWMGGTEEERLAADLALRACILEKTGNEELADLMYAGVRLGGSPYFYNWYRWGYGWGYDRKYAPLSGDERAMVDTKLKKYFESDQQSPCSRATMEDQQDK